MWALCTFPPFAPPFFLVIISFNKFISFGSIKRSLLEESSPRRSVLPYEGDIWVSWRSAGCGNSILNTAPLFYLAGTYIWASLSSWLSSLFWEVLLSLLSKSSSLRISVLHGIPWIWKTWCGYGEKFVGSMSCSICYIWLIFAKGSNTGFL